MVAGQRVLVSLADVYGRGGGDDPGHVNVGQPVGEVVDVHVQTVARHLPLDPGLLGPEEGRHRVNC